MRVVESLCDRVERGEGGRVIVIEGLHVAQNGVRVLEERLKLRL